MVNTGEHWWKVKKTLDRVEILRGFDGKTSLKAVVDARIFHDLVCYVAGFNSSINRHAAISCGAVPYIMVALAVADEIATVLDEHFPYFLFVFRHYATAGTCGTLKFRYTSL